MNALKTLRLAALIMVSFATHTASAWNDDQIKALLLLSQTKRAAQPQVTSKASQLLAGLKKFGRGTQAVGNSALGLLKKARTAAYNNPKTTVALTAAVITAICWYNGYFDGMTNFGGFSTPNEKSIDPHTLNGQTTFDFNNQVPHIDPVDFTHPCVGPMTEAPCLSFSELSQPAADTATCPALELMTTAADTATCKALELMTTAADTATCPALELMTTAADTATCPVTIEPTVLPCVSEIPVEPMADRPWFFRASEPCYKFDLTSKALNWWYSDVKCQ